MADACNVFMNTVRGALATAEAELVESGIDKKKVQSALEEVRSLLRPISFRHFERPEEFRHKEFKRRMTPGCSVKHPWKVIVKEKLPKELFDMVEATVSRTSFGEISMKTQTNCLFTFTSQKEVRKLFSDLTDKSTGRGSFLKRRLEGGKRVEAIIDKDKQFDVKYSFHKEMIIFEFYYGYWNGHGWPQHNM
ncbi:unnamed protein product [Porites lobata]|uniref:Uncharacterized protein n=1 Tax=Porites lobata TaxID=104759 RepID=A0ABN8QVV2_9CNID|nr:unnamed protein product [Porites lobata]